MNLPIGSIIIWVNTNVPAGWQICDGTNGTPNLVGRFVMGASIDGDLEDVGGVATHLHGNGATDAAGAHAHNQVGGRSGDASEGNYYGGSGSSGAYGHSHDIDATPTINSNHTHDLGNTDEKSSMPPYKTVLFIQRMI